MWSTASLSVSTSLDTAIAWIVGDAKLATILCKGEERIHTFRIVAELFDSICLKGNVHTYDLERASAEYQILTSAFMPATDS